MLHSDIDRTSLTIQPSTQTLQWWLNRDFISPILKQELAKVNVLLTPKESYIDDTSRFFPQGTEAVLYFLKNANSAGIIIDICIEDSDYQELLLHSEVLTLPDFILQLIVAPIFAGLLVEFLRNRLGSRQSKTTVRSSITIVDDDSHESITLTYEGNAKEFEEVMGKTISLLDKPAKLSQLRQMADLDYEERIRRLSQDK